MNAHHSANYLLTQGAPQGWKWGYGRLWLANVADVANKYRCLLFRPALPPCSSALNLSPINTPEVG